MRKIYLLFAFVLLLCIGCQWRLGNGDKESEWLFSISRYDRVECLYLTTGDVSALQQMNTEFPQQTRTLIEDVLHLGRVNDPLINNRFYRFYQDSTLQMVLAETQRQYADMSDVNQQLSDAFENLLKLLPEVCVPEVYTQVGAFDQSIIVANDMLGISLDKYLGADYPLYRKFGYSPEQLQTMQRKYIVPDCMSFYLLYLFPPATDHEPTQQERDAHIGRIQWMVNKVVRQNFFHSPEVMKTDNFMKKHPQVSAAELMKNPVKF